MINYFLIFISFFHYLILLFFYEKKIPIHVIESKLGLFFDRNVVFSDTTTIKKNRSRNSNVKNNNITKTINIMFMLPLLIMDSTNKNHELLSERALSFYLGSKYASDFFLSKKQKINIQVFDTKNEKNRIIKFLETYNFSNTHVIIGPFFRSSLEEVSKKNKKIPIISPFHLYLLIH